MAVLLLLAFGALHLGPGRRYVVARVFELLRAQQIEVTAEDVRYNLARLSLSLDNARVTSLRAPDLAPFATVARGQVNLSIGALIRGRYEVESARLSGVAIHYVVAADGTTNLPTPPTPDLDEPVEVIDYLMRDTLVEDSRVRYEDRARGLDVVMPVARLRVDGQVTTGRHDVELTAGPGTALADGRTVALTALEAKADVGRDDAVIERLQLQAAASRLDVSGRIDRFNAPVVEVTLRADLDTAAMAAVAGLAEPVQGRLALDAAASGALDALTVTASGRSDGLTLRDLAPAAVSFQGGYAAAAAVATVDALELSAPWGRLSASGTIALADEPTRVSARIAGLDAETVMTALALPSRVAATVSGDLDAAMPGLAYREANGRASFTLTATAPVSRVDVVPVRGTVRATASGDRIEVRLDRVDALATRLTGAVSVRELTSLDGTLQAAAGDVGAVVRAVEAFLGRPAGTVFPAPVSGAIAVQARLGGTLADPALRAVLDAPALGLGQLHGVRLSGTARATRDAVDLAEFRATWDEAIVTATGRAALTGTRAVRARLTADALGVAGLLSALDIRDVPAAGTLAADADVAGTLDRLEARVRLRGADLVAYGEPLGTLTVEGRLADRQARLDSAVLDKPQQDGGAGRVAASGTYGLERGDYTFSLTSAGVRLEQLVLPDGTTARGVVRIAGQGRGTADRPEGTVEFDGRDLVIAGREAGDVSATVTLADREAIFAAAAPRFATTARGAVAIDAPYQGRADVTVAGLALEALPLQLDTPLTGRIRADIHAEGPAATPAAAVMSATIEELDARWNGLPVTLTAPATVALADRVVTLADVRIEALDSTATISGRLPLDAGATPGALDLDARLTLATLAGYAPRGFSLSADGTLTVQGRVTGTAAAIDPDVTMALENGLLLMPELGPPVTDLQFQARVAGGVAAIDRLSAAWGTARLESTGRAPLTLLGLPVAVPNASGGATLEARVTGLDLGAVPGAPAGVSGHVALHVNAAAASADPAAVEGQVIFDALELGYRGLTLAQQRPSAITMAGGAAVVETLALSGSAGAVEASGTVALTGDRRVDLTTTGALDLAVLSVVTDAARASGPVRFDVRAAGPLAQPQLQGFAALTDGSVVIDDPADVAVENLVARLDLDGARITLSQLSGQVNGGALSGGGTVTLGAALVEDADLQLSVDELAFSAPLDLRSLSDVDLRLNRRGENFIVGGEVRITEAGLTGDINFDTGLLGAIGRPRGLDLTAERDPLLERLRFDVHVATGTPILLDNNLATAELTTNVTVLGTPYDLGMSGRMELLEGSLVTLNERRYEVERGLITFTDDRRITPSFDLRLTTEARHYDITLGVTGEVGATETSFTANPPLPEPDIMALLVTGRTLDDMRGEEYEVAREQVLSYLTGRVGSSLGRGIERATGLSEVRVEPTLIANEADPGARLTVGQELTDGLRLIYSTDLADSSNQNLGGRVRHHPPLRNPRRAAARQHLSRRVPPRPALRRRARAAAHAAQPADHHRRRGPRRRRRR